MRRAARERQATVERLTGREKKADALATRARGALDEQLRLAERQKKERDAVQDRLQEVEQLLASLTADQLADVARLEAQGTTRAQEAFMASGALSSTGRAPSRAGDEALSYAVRQIGKPYVWGAEGPDSFDCSGLTSQAWAHAGRVIPRTSQEQWASLPRVPMSELRPGDLVIYFPKATHVAMYLGDGMVVQAPAPAPTSRSPPSRRTPSSARSARTRARPRCPVTDPPPLPDGAKAGADTGYGAAGAPGAGRRRAAPRPWAAPGRGPSHTTPRSTGARRPYRGHAAQSRIPAPCRDRRAR